MFTSQKASASLEQKSRRLCGFTQNVLCKHLRPHITPKAYTAVCMLSSKLIRLCDVNEPQVIN